MWFTLYFPLILTFGLPGLSTRFTTTCTYRESPRPPIEYIVSRTQTIFVGKLISKTEKDIQEDGDSYRISELSFEVIESIKGLREPRQSIYFTETLSRRTSCDLHPPPSEVGEYWVVFIGYDEGSEVQRFVLYEGYLSWVFVKDNELDEARLASIKRAASAPLQSLFGTLQQPMVGRFSRKGLSERVELRSDNGSEVLRSFVPADNEFRFDDLNEGIYTLRVFTDKKAQYFAPAELVSEYDKDTRKYYADFRIRMDRGFAQYENVVLGDYADYEPR